MASLIISQRPQNHCHYRLYIKISWESKAYIAVIYLSTSSFGEKKTTFENRKQKNIMHKSIPNLITHIWDCLSKILWQ